MEKSRKGMAKRSGTIRTNQVSRCSLEKAASRTRKLTSHLRALSLKAPWNCTRMRDQKPLRLRFGDALFSCFWGSIGASPEMVPGIGIEPTRPCGHRILSPARLPVPPARREIRISQADNAAVPRKEDGGSEI